MYALIMIYRIKLTAKKEKVNQYSLHNMWRLSFRLPYLIILNFVRNIFYKIFFISFHGVV